MHKITLKKILHPTVILMDIEAEAISKKIKAGQFVILRIDEKGERVPFTVADTNPENGTITIIFQVAGHTTRRLSRLLEGDFITDVVGPLGHPTPVDENVKNVCVVGGGVGCAIAYPQAVSLHKKGVNVDVIAGFRNEDFIILKDEFKRNSQNLTICTDDGSYGFKGFVTEALKLAVHGDEKAGVAPKKYDLIIAIGPVSMMKFTSQVAKMFDIPIIVSLNPIMIDGTGMCGCCRVTVDGVTKYACVDGPDFDGYLVDYDELSSRNNTYVEEEHICRINN
jgi:ferredoxin--NADP+ reductase